MEFTVEELLNQWGFMKYIQTFHDNEVDIEALELLDDLQIKSLIPAIGPQAKFKKKLCDWKKSRHPALTDKKDIIDEDFLDKILSEDPPGSPLSSAVSLCEEKRPPGSPLSSVSGLSRVSCVSDVSTRECEKNLINLLEKTQEGQLLLKERCQPLGDNLRKVLAREISREIVNRNPKAAVTAEIYLHWTSEIGKVFPAEDQSVYYTGPKGAGRPHGRLYDAIGNLKAKYRKNHIYKPRPHRRLDIIIAESHQKTCHQRLIFNNDLIDTEDDEELNAEINECLTWLKSSVDNYALCAEKWKVTNKLRLQRVLQEKELHTYLSDFPCLRRSWGLNLLIEDFNRWYPGNELNFQNKFPLLKTKLLPLTEKISVKLSFVTKLKALVKDADPQTSTLAALLLIPHILGPVHIAKKKSSASEVRDSFILHIEEEQQLNEARRGRQEKYKKLGITVQPYIVVAGPLEQISTRYVVLNDIVYEVACISDAVDACFKIIWALYLEYPRESLHVWQFLQRAIYDIPDKALDKRERVVTKVLALLTDCCITTN